MVVVVVVVVVVARRSLGSPSLQSELHLSVAASRAFADKASCRCKMGCAAAASTRSGADYNAPNVSVCAVVVVVVVVDDM